MAEPNPALPQALDRLLQHYRQNYEIQSDASVGSVPVAALARFRSVEEKTLFGFKLQKGMMGKNESGEVIAFLLAERLTLALAEEMSALVKKMEEHLLELSDDHGFTVFSVALLTCGVDRDAARELKRFRMTSEYQKGWGMGRLAAYDLETGKGYGSADGKVLARLMAEHLA